MMRRFFVTHGAPLAVIAIAGCLGEGGPSGDDDSGNETDTEETATDIETRFEVHDIDTGILEESATVEFEDGTVIVTGAILGSNTCYTARLGTVAVDDRTLLVGVESYEDLGENEGCYDAIVGVEYETTVEIHGDLPESVRVEHNGEHVTTEQPS